MLKDWQRDCRKFFAQLFWEKKNIFLFTKHTYTHEAIFVYYSHVYKCLSFWFKLDEKETAVANMNESNEYQQQSTSNQFKILHKAFRRRYLH